MTHTPPDSKAWTRAGAADRPSASGEQTRQPDKQPASDLPTAASDESSGRTPPFPEAKRHEGDRRPDEDDSASERH